MTDVTYASYLSLDPLLSAQYPVSDNHDELLFIILHQTKELWLKQILAELALAKGLVREGRLTEAYKGLARVSRIQAVMTLSWDVLATMTPADYSAFRHVLGKSSGFQSDQFRAAEVTLGVRGGGGSSGPLTQDALDQPSLWDDANAALAALGFDLPPHALARDWRRPYVPDPAVEAAWSAVYRNPQRWWEPYQLAEKLVHIDDALATWRHKHVVTVARVIGGKMGTGGSWASPTSRARCPTAPFPSCGRFAPRSEPRQARSGG